MGEVFDIGEESRKELLVDAMGDPGVEGSGVSVTRISGLGGGCGERRCSLSEWGGLAGSTTSTGRLSTLIMMSVCLCVGHFIKTAAFLKFLRKYWLGRADTKSAPGKHCASTILTERLLASKEVFSISLVRIQ